MASQRKVRQLILSILTILTIFAVYFYHKRTKAIIKPVPKKQYIKVVYPTENVVFKKKLLLTVGVLSKLSAVSRRMAIRATWFTVCKDNVDKVDCTFFTDTPEISQAYLMDEKEEYNDTVYMPYHGE